MNFLGVDWVGINAENGQKLILSATFIFAILIVGKILKAIIGRVLGQTNRSSIQTKFWTRQGISLLMAIILVLGLLSIWLNDPGRLATALGLVSAGLAFALQQVITSIAGYFVILRGNTFTVGDRISMGGVRGDVLRLGFVQTTIMEMGQPPSVQSVDPDMWVRSRQFSGRIVTVSNSKIFSEPVYNYTRDFPFIWEEMSIPISYKTNRAFTEAIMLKAAQCNGIDINAISMETRQDLQTRLAIDDLDLCPRVFYRITDNWLELTVRFIVQTHKIRIVKDAMSRQILEEFDKAEIGIASATYDIVGFPTLQVQQNLPKSSES